MFVRIILPLMFCNSGAFILIAHMVALGEERGLTPMRASVLLAVTFGITIISRLSSGALIDKGLQRAVLYISTLLLPIGGLVLLLGGEFFFLSILAVVLLGLGYGGVFPFYTFFVRSVFPAAAAGTWISAMFMFGFFAAALGSWLGAFLHDLVGDYRLAIWVSILLTTMSALIAAILLEEALCADRPGTHS